MHKKSNRAMKAAARQFFAVCLGALALALVTDSVAQAQKKDIPVELRIKYDLNQPFTPGNLILELRPNVEQSVWLFVENRSPDRIKPFNVKLQKIEADGTATTVKQVTVTGLEGTDKKNNFQMLSFGGKGKKEEKKKNGKDGIALAPAPFELQVDFEDPTGKYKAKKVLLPVRIRHPREYVSFDSGTFENDKLFINFSGGKKIFGPTCLIRLNMDPELVPGLLPVKTKGVYKQVLSADRNKDNSVGLKAQELQYQGGSVPKFGRFHVSADGYQRAFMFTNSSTKGKIIQLSAAKPRIRLRLPRFSAPTPKIPATVEVDAPIKRLQSIRASAAAPRPQPLQIRIDIDPEGPEGTGDNYLPAKTLTGLRQESVSFNPEGPGGALLFNTSVKDWQFELNATDIFGQVYVRARIGEAPKKRSQPFRPLEVQTETGAEEISAYRKDNSGSPFAPLISDARSVQAVVTLDGTGPAIDFPLNLRDGGRHRRGKLVHVRAKVSDAAPVSPIKDVVFFIGKPGPKGEIPKAADKEAGVPDPDQAGVWKADLPIKTDKAAVFFVSVMAVNQAGQSKIKTIKLILEDAPKDGAAAGTGSTTITGSVVVGGIPQPNVAVALADAKGKVKATGKSDDKGQFKFEKVAPGVYTVNAANPALKLTGTAAVTVPEGKPKIEGVSVSMTR